MVMLMALGAAMTSPLWLTRVKRMNTDGMEGGDDQLTGTDASEMNTDTISIKSTYAIYRVTWKNTDG